MNLIAQSDSTLGRGVTVIECVEHERVSVDPSLWMRQDFSAVFDPEVADRDILRVSFSRAGLRLQASSFVGVIPVNSRLVLKVRPRFPIANLTQMVLDTGHGVMALTALREYRGYGLADDWAMEHYIDALIDYVEIICEHGLFQSYAEISPTAVSPAAASTSFLPFRGLVRAAFQTVSPTRGLNGHLTQRRIDA